MRLVDPSGMQPERTVEVSIDEKGVYHLPSSMGEVVSVSAQAPPPDKLELAIRNKLIHVLTVDEFERKLRWEHKQGNSGYAASWTHMETMEYDWATDQERVAMSEAKWWDYVNKEYAGYRAGKSAEWDKSSRLMATYGKIGKGIGWGVVAAIGLFGGAAVATPGSLLGGGTGSTVLAGGGGATTAASTGTGVVATAQVTTGKVMTAVATNTGAYVVASTVYGAVTPPGAPDLPGPMDNAGRALKNLGVASDEVGDIASGAQIWGKIVRGQAEIAPYFKYEGGRLTAGILGMFSHSKTVSSDMVKAYLVFRQQTTALAKALGAKTLRLEASTVINEVEVPRMLKKLGFQEKPNDPSSFFLDIVLN